jgi:hypothetical protein
VTRIDCFARLSGKYQSGQVCEGEENLAFSLGTKPERTGAFHDDPVVHIATPGAVQAEIAMFWEKVTVLAARFAREQGSTDKFRTFGNTDQVRRQDI